MATSPKKNPTPKRSMPTKQRKSVKISTKGNYSDGTVGDSMQETVKRTKLRKQTSRKSIKATDLREKEVDQGAGATTIYRGFKYLLLICR